MIKLQYLNEDALKLNFVPFAIKENVKKWLYNMPIESITS